LTLDWQRGWIIGGRNVMLPERSASTEWLFLSSDVARMADVSLRQMQWWDERKLVSPRIEDHRRVYIPEQVLEILTVAALRRKGLSLQRIRKVLRLVRRELEQRGGRLLAGKSKVYVITDGNSLFVNDQPDGVLNRIAEAKHPMYLVCLTDQMSIIKSEKDRPSSQ
jgi:DNA-binding transcriptional MerR regulator